MFDLQDTKCIEQLMSDLLMLHKYLEDTLLVLYQSRRSSIQAGIIVG